MKEAILTPVGRLVMGSLYKPNNKKMDGTPLVDKNGQPRAEFWVHLAIAKGAETHWNQTAWGQIINRVGFGSFPAGQFKLPSFYWKIEDGDSTELNRNGNKPCDNQGYPKHWILKFKSGFAPTLLDKNASPLLLPEGAVECGDYIQIFGSVSGNDNNQSPGVYLNFSHVAFMAYGERIVTSIDPKSIGFGGPLPVGAIASDTPIAQGFAPSATMSIPVGAPSIPAAAPVVPPPHTAILKPKVMLPAANGIPYESFIAQKWTDELLIQHGMMAP